MKLLNEPNRMLFGILTFFLLFVSVSSVNAQQQMQDVVYLKDGSVIRGVIIEQVPGVSLKIQTRDGSIFVYKMENVVKIAKEPLKEVQKEVQIKGKKNPALAWFLSFLIPGVGQFYNEEVGKGAVHFLLDITGAVMYVNGFETVDYYDYWTGDYLYSETKITGVGVAGAVIMLSTWIWSMIDAPVSASRINRELQQSHLFKFGDDKYALDFKVFPYRKGLRTSLVLSF